MIQESVAGFDWRGVGELAGSSTAWRQDSEGARHSLTLPGALWWEQLDIALYCVIQPKQPKLNIGKVSNLATPRKIPVSDVEDGGLSAPDEPDCDPFLWPPRAPLRA